MNTFDTLQILIEANYSGLQTQLKQGLNQIQQFVQNANGQAINWRSILGSTVTPALMATIASAFALSVAQALQFQAAVQGASLNTTTAFGNTTAAMTNGAYNISAATGQSANDVENAIGQVSMVYKNYNDALTVTNDLAQFATVEHLNLADAIGVGLPLLQQWGVSAGDAANVLATLGESTSFGKLSISQLTDMLTNAGPALSKLTTLPQAIAQLQEASTVPGFTPDAIKNMFDVVVQGAQNVKDPVNKIFGDMATSLATGGFAKALDNISNKIQGWGSDAQIVGKQFGLTANTISENLTAPANAFSDINELAKQFLQNLEPLNKWFTDNQTMIDKFKEAWATLIADLEKAAVPPLIEAMIKVLDGADVLTKIFSEGVNGPTANTVSTGLTSMGVSNLNSVESGNLSALPGLIGDAFLKGISNLVQYIGGATSGNSTGTGSINFNIAPNSAMGQAAQKVVAAASSHQLPTAQ